SAPACCTCRLANVSEFGNKPVVYLRIFRELNRKIFPLIVYLIILHQVQLHDLPYAGRPKLRVDRFPPRLVVSGNAGTKLVIALEILHLEHELFTGILFCDVKYMLVRNLGQFSEVPHTVGGFQMLLGTGKAFLLVSGHGSPYGKVNLSEKRMDRGLGCPAYLIFMLRIWDITR